jgi:hypothetical protein
MNEELLSLLGATPEQIAQAQRRSGYEELGLLGQALSAAGAPAPRGTSTLQRLGQAGQVYTQAPRQTMDTLLQDLLRKQQIQDMQKKRERQARSEAARQQFAQQFAPMTSQTALAAPGRVGPTAARAGMIGQAPPLDRNQLFAQSLNPDLPGDLRQAAAEAFKATAPAETKLPTSAQEFELAQQNPQFAAFLSSRDEAKGTKVSVKMNETLGKRLDTNLANFEKNGSTARSALPTVRAMSALLDEGVQTGFGQETINRLNQAAQLFNPGYKAKEVAGQEAFIAYSNEIILPQVKQLGVSPTDADLNFIVKGSPSLSKSVNGNKLLLSALDLKLQRDAFLQEFVVDWENQNIGLVEQSPARANTLLRKAVLDLTKTHPLWTESVDRLRQQYSQITGGQPSSLTANSPFSRK